MGGKNVQFVDSAEGKELHIEIDFQRGSRFANDKGEMVSISIGAHHIDAPQSHRPNIVSITILHRHSWHL